jgi:putative DNA primase/helicase
MTTSDDDSWRENPTGESPRPPTLRVVPPFGTRRPGDKPTIELSVDLEKVVNQGVDALAEMDPHLYQRAGKLAHITHATEDDATGRAPIAAGTPVVHDMAPATLLERLATSAHWKKYDGRRKDHVAVLPPKDVLSAVHSRRQWRGVRHLVGVVTTPTMRPDGTIVQDPGYDSSTGYVYLPNATYPRVPDHPSQDDAKSALGRLMAIWADFPFETDAGRMVPIAALLTILARPAIRDATPAFAFDSPTRGTGKGLSAGVVVEIATGQSPPLATFPTSRNGEEELEKQLAAYALNGSSVVFYDNVPIGVRWGGAPLEKVLTSTLVSPRVLGRSEMPTVPWSAVILVAGNNLAIRDETSRRVLAARMVSTLERPEERTGFTIPDLRAYVRQYRPSLVADALTVLRAYTSHGSPDPGGMLLGSYEPWSRLVPRAILFAGGADVLGARVTLADDTDGDAEAHAAFLTHLPALIGDSGGIEARAIIAAIYPGPTPHEPPDGHEGLRDAIAGALNLNANQTPTATVLGRYMKGIRDRNVGGKRLTVVKAPGAAGAKSRESKRWTVR